MKVESTAVFQVDGTQHVVSGLDASLRKQFEIFDDMRQRQHDIALDLEMATLAVNLKFMQLQEIFRIQQREKDAASAAAAAGESKE